MKNAECPRRVMDDDRGSLAGLDVFTTRALEMIRSPRTRAAFDRYYGKLSSL